MYRLIITAIIAFAAIATAVVLLTVWSCCKVSGTCSREEEVDKHVTYRCNLRCDRAAAVHPMRCRMAGRQSTRALGDSI